MSKVWAEEKELWANHSIAQLVEIANKIKFQADEKQTELRQLVGEKYRDLLCSAELVIQMKNHVRTFQQHLGEGVDALEKLKSFNYKKNKSRTSSLPGLEEGRFDVDATPELVYAALDDSRYVEAVTIWKEAIIVGTVWEETGELSSDVKTHLQVVFGLKDFILHTLFWKLNSKLKANDLALIIYSLSLMDVTMADMLTVRLGFLSKLTYIVDLLNQYQITRCCFYALFVSESPKSDLESSSNIQLLSEHVSFLSGHNIVFKSDEFIMPQYRLSSFDKKSMNLFNSKFLVLLRKTLDYLYSKTLDSTAIISMYSQIAAVLLENNRSFKSLYNCYFNENEKLSDDDLIILIRDWCAKKITDLVCESLDTLSLHIADFNSTLAKLSNLEKSLLIYTRLGLISGRVEVHTNMAAKRIYEEMDKKIISWIEVLTNEDLLYLDDKELSNDIIRFSNFSHSLSKSILLLKSREIDCVRIWAKCVVLSCLGRCYVPGTIKLVLWDIQSRLQEIINNSYVTINESLDVIIKVFSETLKSVFISQLNQNGPVSTILSDITIAFSLLPVPDDIDSILLKISSKMDAVDYFSELASLRFSYLLFQKETRVLFGTFNDITVSNFWHRIGETSEGSVTEIKTKESLLPRLNTLPLTLYPSR